MIVLEWQNLTKEISSGDRAGLDFNSRPAACDDQTLWGTTKIRWVGSSCNTLTDCFWGYYRFLCGLLNFFLDNQKGRKVVQWTTIKFSLIKAWIEGEHSTTLCLNYSTCSDSLAEELSAIFYYWDNGCFKSAKRH